LNTPPNQSVESKALIGTAVACCLVGLLISQPHAAFGLVFFVPFFVIWIPYSLFLIVWKPARRKTQIAKIILWSISVSIVVAIHTYRAREIRARADVVLALVLKHQAEKGAFPKSLAELGVTHDSGRSKLSQVNYLYTDGRPHLFYAATFSVFETYSFDFDTGNWRYNPD
jgi:hypothetical protein